MHWLRLHLIEYESAAHANTSSNTSAYAYAYAYTDTDTHATTDTATSRCPSIQSSYRRLRQWDQRFHYFGNHGHGDSLYPGWE